MPAQDPTGRLGFFFPRQQIHIDDQWINWDGLGCYKFIFGPGIPLTRALSTGLGTPDTNRGALFFANILKNTVDLDTNLFWDHDFTRLTVIGKISVTGTTTFNSVIYAWPGSQGLANTILANDGSGNLSWRNVVPSGASFPASPNEGDLFILDNGAGVRQWLFAYDGVSWNAQDAFGATTLFVDTTNGTDSSAKGFGSGANAYASLQYAWNQIPPIYRGAITITITGQTYTTNLVLQGKSPTGNYKITFQGTLTQLDSLTAAASTQGSGSTQGTVVRNAGTWAVNGRQNKMVRFTSGANSGTYRIIDSNSTTTLTICGTWPSAVGVGDTFVVEDWGTIIAGGAGAALTTQGAQQNVICDSIKFTSNTTQNYAALVQAASNTTFNRCWIDNNLLVQNPGSLATCNQCYADTPAGGVTNNGTIQAQFFGAAVVTGCKILNAIVGPGFGLYAAFMGQISCNQLTGDGNIIDGTAIQATNNGVWANSNSNVSLYTPGGWNRIRNWANGAMADDCSSIVYSDPAAYVAYSGNTTNQNGVAATFGVVRNGV